MQLVFAQRNQQSHSVMTIQLTPGYKMFLWDQEHKGQAAVIQSQHNYFVQSAIKQFVIHPV